MSLEIPLTDRDRLPWLQSLNQLRRFPKTTIPVILGKSIYPNLATRDSLQEIN